MGVGTPGICDAARGVVVSSGTWAGGRFPWLALLRHRLGVPVRLENDANCAAWGEQWCGAARGVDDVILFTLGTGVGGALILGGHVPTAGRPAGRGSWASIRVAPTGRAACAGDGMS